jgi:hypothetical protein
LSSGGSCSELESAQSARNSARNNNELNSLGIIKNDNGIIQIKNDDSNSSDSMGESEKSSIIIIAEGEDDIENNISPNRDEINAHHINNNTNNNSLSALVVSVYNSDTDETWKI